jgi:hypothetical protein
MTPTDMETLLQNHDTRLARVEHILPTLATKGALAELRDELTLRVEQRLDGTPTQLRREMTACEVDSTTRSNGRGIRFAC